jgi:hypothetical protein
MQNIMATTRVNYSVLKNESFSVNLGIDDMEASTFFSF